MAALSIVVLRTTLASGELPFATTTVYVHVCTDVITKGQHVASMSPTQNFPRGTVVYVGFEDDRGFFGVSIVINALGLVKVIFTDNDVIWIHISDLINNACCLEEVPDDIQARFIELNLQPIPGPTPAQVLSTHNATSVALMTLILQMSAAQVNALHIVAQAM